MKLLIHVCCGPCFIAPYHHLKDEHDITAFWFNHNIHPYTEYVKRRDTLRDFVKKYNITYIEKDEYDLDRFIQNSVFKENKRCISCYYERLKYTAIIAKKGKFDGFTSTLLYSKHQNHKLMIEIAESLAKEYGVNFYYQDFREYWKEGIELSKEEAMYRQQYCGCIYSERDRYYRKEKL